MVIGSNKKTNTPTIFTNSVVCMRVNPIPNNRLVKVIIIKYFSLITNNVKTMKLMHIARSILIKFNVSFESYKVSVIDTTLSASAAFLLMPGSIDVSINSVTSNFDDMFDHLRTHI